MKVTNISTLVVNAEMRNWVFCKVYTNGGLVGLGEGSVTSKEATVAQAIMEHERSVVFQQAGNRLHAQKALLLMMLT